MTKRFYCNFCGRSDQEARRIVTCGHTSICDSCAKAIARLIGGLDETDAGALEYASWFEATA